MKTTKIPTYPIPSFQWQFLHPKYWLLWLMFSLLFLISWLPFSIQLFLGRTLGYLSKFLLKKRYHIAKRNLELCFPEMDATEITKLLNENFKNVGFALFEVGMAWFWPDWRIKKHFEYRGFEYLTQLKEGDRGCLILAIHSLNLELAGRAFGLLYPGYGMYRPNRNLFYNWVQYRGRVRSNLGQVDRKQLKTLFYILKNDGAVWYAADHDYGRKATIFAPFFSVDEAATTLGTSMFVDRTHCHISSFTCIRSKSKYIIEVNPIESNFPIGNPKASTLYANKIIERAILKAPEQYMWLHRRFKTRPNEDDPSFY